MTFQFWPVPDGIEPNCQQGKNICACNRVDACALSHSGCLNGCHGEQASSLIKFVSCFEGSDREGSCQPAKSDSCAAAAGLEAQAINACLSNTTEVAAIQTQIQAASSSVHMFPKVAIDGKITFAQTDAAVAKALCSKGVQSAC